MPIKRRSRPTTRFRLDPSQLRPRCNPERFEFKTTAELEDTPIDIIGQDRALEALRLGLAVRSEGYNIFVAGAVGGGRSTSVRRMLEELDLGQSPPDDLVFVNDFEDPDQPHFLVFQGGEGRRFSQAMDDLIETLFRDLPQLFDSKAYRNQRSTMLSKAGQQQKDRLREFEKQVQGKGFTLVQVQMGPLTRPNLVPVLNGNPVEMDQLEEMVDRNQFTRKELEKLQKTQTRLRGEMESLGKEFRRLDRTVRSGLAQLDRELARPLIEEAVGDVRDSFSAEGISTYLDQVSEDLLVQLDGFREGQEVVQDATGKTEETVDRTRYQVNVVVDNSRTRGRPVIWETAPTYRNLFGTIEKIRNATGEWETDFTRIKSGSLLQANAGFLVLDAMDLLVEPGVWAALKRTLRNRTVEIQSFDPGYPQFAVSLKPEPVPIDVKVLIIGTRNIYRLLHRIDEDFTKIFKIKAELAHSTPRSEEELANYARFVQKKVRDDTLLPFDRGAVAAVVEHGVRLSGHLERLTTRFNEIADVVREASFWARKNRARSVRVQHVDQALAQRVHRVNLVEEMLREKIAEGSILIDLEGWKVGQVNGLVVLDLGDHVFGQPSRITATTAMGRAGIIDLDREANLSGAIHTKGVLILTGFLRERFAQDRPLTLTASLCFEQNYGGIDGDSASSAELYALLSSLSEVPIRQGIAVTGSVNQRGEIQPIGGVNEKVEGYFDLCRLTGLTGKQGVMIPAQNLPQLMLRKDVVSAVRRRRFYVWAVSTVEEGLEVLTDTPAGVRGEDGKYAEGTIFALAEARLADLAERVRDYGPADLYRQ